MRRMVQIKFLIFVVLVSSNLSPVEAAGPADVFRKGVTAVKRLCKASDKFRDLASAMRRMTELMREAGDQRRNLLNLQQAVKRAKRAFDEAPFPSRAAREREWREASDALRAALDLLRDLSKEMRELQDIIRCLM